MAKIDNIPLNDNEAFKKPLKDAYVVHREHLKPLEGSKSIKLSKEQREELKARRESLAELSKTLHKPNKSYKIDTKTIMEVIPKLSKRGCMDYINRHTLVHINPSAMRKMDKKVIKELAKTIEHVR